MLFTERASRAAFGGAGFSRRRTSVRLSQVSHRLSEAG
jgi:hypothetical protein